MHSKAVQGDYKQNEKPIHKMGENICKLSDWWRINLQNIQAAHAALCQKTKQNKQKKIQ